MKNAQYEDMDDERGYRVQCMTGTVAADKQDVPFEEYRAINPKNKVLSARAPTLKELKDRVAALPQCYAEVDGYLVELTHDFGEPRDIVVNVYDDEGNSVGRVGRIPWGGGTVDDVLACLPEDADPSQDELLDVVTLGRTPPTKNKDKK